MTHNILPTAGPGRTAQPARTAMQLALKDELRTFGFNLQRGAHWLLQDVGGSLVKQVEPRNEAGTLHKLHHLIDSTAQATFSTLQVAQQAAAVAVLPDAAYRTLHFELRPLADYFAQGEPKNPSQPFTDAFYWLLRHALAGKPGSALIARQQAIDEAFWQVLEQHADLIARAREAHATPRDHAALCAAVLQALVAARPVRDASLPPWAGQPAHPLPDAAAALPELLAVAVTVGLAKKGDNPTPDIGERLRLAEQLVTARLPLLEAALQQPDRQLLTAELAFLFRHA